MPNTENVTVNKIAFDALVAKSAAYDSINSAGVRGSTGHQKITLDRSTFNTLVRNTHDLTTLFNNGVMEWDGFDNIDWDNA